MELHVAALLRDIAEKEGLHSNFRTRLTNSVGGKSFHGVVRTVTLQDDTRRISLIVKTCQSDGLTRSVQRTRDKFRNEVIFYRDIVERLRSYGEMPYVPKYYGSCLEELKETIVLEDLRAENFVLKSLSDGLNAAHLNIVAKALARLHATSLKWETRDPRAFRNAVDRLKETFFLQHENPEGKKLATLLYQHALNAGLMCADSKLSQQCSDYIKNFMLGGLEGMNEWVTPREEENFTTILHGDAWCHNFLFKYNTDGEPVDVALIDWQMVKVGSPMLDLTQCFLSSADLDTLTNPRPFVDRYSEGRGIPPAELMEDVPRWGRPGLLLALSIVVNVLDGEGSDPLSQKFEKAVRDGVVGVDLSLETRKRLEKIMQSAALLGIKNC